jgi:membrane-bound lytic murein transglycosylase MltF
MVYRILRCCLLCIMCSNTTASPAPDSATSLLLSEREQLSFSQMLELRTIRALVVYNKTNYFIDGAKQKGISYDLLKSFEQKINEDLDRGHLKIHVFFIPVARDQLIPALLEGRGDIAAANITISPERMERVDFSEPLLKNVQEFLVTGPGTGQLTSTDQLAGKTVHVRKSSSYYHSLLATNKALIAKGHAPIELVLANEHLEDEDLLEMVNAGLVPAIVIDSHKAEFWLQIYDQLTLQRDIPLRSGAAIGWAFRKDSPELAAAVNSFVKKNRKGSLLGNMLFKRYWQNTSHVRNALSSSEMKKFQATAELFKTYAGQYDFDWLMLMAQAYQESSLDNSTRSSAGAVGIMQLLPSTAAGKSVNIKDVAILENNIHAGAKYMRFIQDRYFDDPGINAEDKMMFTFAAYNAGPGRVAKLRKEATEMGLNPDIWFHNVEIVAAKRIGSETVQYVSNIFKYWIAYQLALADQHQ